MRTIYEEYAILDSQIKLLEEQKDALRIKVIAEMTERGEEKVDTMIGKFSITKLKKWKYPDYVTEMGEEFKAAKAKAESTGEATYEEQDSLRYTTIKL